MDTMQDISVTMNKEQKEIQKILQSTFGLTKKQTLLFVKLLCRDDKKCCINHLIDDEQIPGRSTVQKYLKILLKKGLVLRESKTLAEYQEMCKKRDIDENYQTNKGYLYVYRSISKEELIKKAQNIWDTWKQKIENIL